VRADEKLTAFLQLESAIPENCAILRGREQGAISAGINREPSLRIVRFINEVLPVLRVSGALPAHAGERQISIVSSSFPIALICQIQELLLDGMRVNYSRSGKPIKKVNQRVNRFHPVSTFGWAPQNSRLFGRSKFEIGSSTAQESSAPFGRLWYAGQNAVNNAIGHAIHRSRAHAAMIRVYDGAGNVIETHEHRGDFKEW